MAENLVPCKECRFWIPEVKENAGLADFGVCIQPGSANWFLSKHKDACCGNGELKTKVMPPYKA